VKDKSLEMLEFPRVVEILAGYTGFAVSREMALALKPFHSFDHIDRLLKQSAEARHLLSIEPDISIGGIYDVREAVGLAARGKILELQTLVDIQRTLTSIRFLHNKLGRLENEIPILAEINKKITPLPELEKEIARCISPGAELMDTASDRLVEIRQLLKDKRLQILARLDSMVKSSENERYIQDPLITERDGRYVIPVKVEVRKEFKGIVHDISNTGATAFIEPMATVDLGNELRELVIEEQHEIERILAALSAQIGAEEVSVATNLKLVAEIDLALAKARFADRFKAVEPILTGVKTEDGAISPRLLRLKNARHPLLKGKPVPLNLEMGDEFKGLVITGPNTGGKTVALKSIGLLALMAHAGLPIPAAHESCVPLFDNIFADIGDEQSIEATLSTFSWHMGNIVNIIKDATDTSLVLLDELGTATDPSEGAALAQSILKHFVIRGNLVVATTHFSELKAFAHATPGMRNASLDFDPVTLAPTYHLTLGIPGGSNALAIASHLGLPQEIINGAKERLSKGAIEIETMLADLMQEKQNLEATQNAIRQEKEKAEKLRLQLEEERQRLKDKEQELLHETRARLVREGDELLKEIRDVMSELKKVKSQEKVEQAQKALAVLREQLKSKRWKPAAGPDQSSSGPAFAPGARVWLAGMNVQGTVASGPDGDGQYDIVVGSTHVRMAPENLSKAEASKKPVWMTPSGIRGNVSRRTVSSELDLRGKRADEVEIELDGYIDDASLSNLSEVRIIHGIATGTVRQIVRAYLALHPLVSSFRSGNRDEGGDGVTVVRL
jgi:DNA mismatch repair protein MutS2